MTPDCHHPHLRPHTEHNAQAFPDSADNQYDYHLVGGKPDQFVIESWAEGPSRSVPETDDWTHTRAVRAFCRRFAPENLRP
jgi:hypothetical protein